MKLIRRKYISISEVISLSYKLLNKIKTLTFFYLVNSSGTVVEHSTREPKIETSSPATGKGNKKNKMVKKVLSLPNLSPLVMLFRIQVL
jgi:hypothetical protein